MMVRVLLALYFEVKPLSHGSILFIWWILPFLVWPEQTTFKFVEPLSFVAYVKFSRGYEVGWNLLRDIAGYLDTYIDTV
jgi:hypothetical protein